MRQNELAPTLLSLGKTDKRRDESVARLRQANRWALVSSADPMAAHMRGRTSRHVASYLHRQQATQNKLGFIECD